MPTLRIHGGQRLSGTVKLSGAKNSATKLMVASLLTAEPCTLRGCPKLGDTAITEELLRAVGASVSWSGSSRHIISIASEGGIPPEAGDLTADAKSLGNGVVPSLSRKNRISILALAPLLHRLGQAEVPVLGGDQIGPRPVDFHLQALRQMGAQVREESGRYIASASSGLRGASFSLPYPSVGATETVLFSGVLAKGRTTLANAALEPEVLDLIMVLQQMGAIIELGASRSVAIEGVKGLRGFDHLVMPDRNEAVSYACLAIATGGEVEVERARQEDLVTFLNVVRRIGADYEVNGNGIRFFRANGLRAIELETDTHPGYMTDWQQPLAVLLTQAKGTSVIHETVYEDRFGYTEQLNRMGAGITVFKKCLGELPCRWHGQAMPHSAVINGPTPLHGSSLVIPDIRAGLAHVIAALVAEGESTLTGYEHLERGYEDFVGKLKSLGAEVEFA